MKNEGKPLTWETLAELVGKDAADSIKARADLGEGLAAATNYYQQLLALRRYYESKEYQILEAFKKSKHLWARAYPTDWSQLLTPIEFLAWQTIRAKGRIVLYPQYPILKYYADFANPGLKIALELDGMNYHNSDKDRIRDENIKAEGWTIYRITGREMYNSKFKDWQVLDEQEIEEDHRAPYIQDWLMNSGDGVIEAIKTIHFTENRDRFYETDLGTTFLNYCHKTLEKHQS
jgi:very-short-patch-repair endonuclease